MRQVEGLKIYSLIVWNPGNGKIRGLMAHQSSSIIPRGNEKTHPPTPWFADEDRGLGYGSLSESEWAKEIGGWENLGYFLQKSISGTTRAQVSVGFPQSVKERTWNRFVSNRSENERTWNRYVSNRSENERTLNQYVSKQSVNERTWNRYVANGSVNERTWNRMLLINL